MWCLWSSARIFCIYEYYVFSTARNHSFCSPRWNAPTFSTLYNASARPGTMTLDGTRPLSSRMMTHEVRPTATWPRTPKPQKTTVTGPSSPRSVRRMMRTGDVQPPPPVMKRSMWMTYCCSVCKITFYVEVNCTVIWLETTRAFISGSITKCMKRMFSIVYVELRIGVWEKNAWWRVCDAVMVWDFESPCCHWPC